MNEQEEYVVVWEAPKLETPEFRLYFDDNGSVICYTGDKSLSGDNYIVIDALTFAEGRHDIRVIDGKISTVKPSAVVYKLMPNSLTGIACHQEDISVIVDESESHTKWKLNIYELQ